MKIKNKLIFLLLMTSIHILAQKKPAYEPEHNIDLKLETVNHKAPKRFSYIPSLSKFAHMFKFSPIIRHKKNGK